MLNQFLEYVYILLLIAAIGPNVTYAVWIQRAMADRAALPFTLKGIKVLNDRVVLPATALLLIAWIAMALTAGQSILTPWILLVLILWLVVFLVGIFAYSPTLNQQITLAESAGADSNEYKSVAWRGTLLGIAIGVVVLVIIFLMVFEPTLWG
jgi:uncharacterized membrane protein